MGGPVATKKNLPLSLSIGTAALHVAPQRFATDASKQEDSKVGGESIPSGAIESEEEGKVVVIPLQALWRHWLLGIELTSPVVIFLIIKSSF